MAMTLEIWEDSGAPTGSPALPAVRHSINNLGWKDSGLDETFVYVDYPIQRPITGGPNRSFTKYYYFKISGTYPAGITVTPIFSGNPNGDAPDSLTSTDGFTIKYKTTNVYATPSTTALTGASTFTVSGSPEFGEATWVPFWSTTGPEDATSLVSFAADTTYYSNYFVSQLEVADGVWTDYGNLGAMTLKLEVREREK